MVQAWFADFKNHPGYPTLVGEEVSVFEPNIGIRGSVDVVVTFPSGETKPIEIKTINSREFARLTAPKPLHKLQLQTYMYLLGHDEGIVLYIEKDYPHEMKEFTITAQAPHDVFRRWIKVREAIIANDCSGLEFECKPGSTTEERCVARNICRRVL